MTRLPIQVAVSLVLAGCQLADSLVGPAPCWPDEPGFTYTAMTIEGLLEADPNDSTGLWLVLPDGRELDPGWPPALGVSVGPGRTGQVRTSSGRIVVEAGQRVTLTGALVRAGPDRQRAASGRDGFVICDINGTSFTPPRDLKT